MFDSIVYVSYDHILICGVEELKQQHHKWYKVKNLPGLIARKHSCTCALNGSERSHQKKHLPTSSMLDIKTDDQGL